MFLNFNTAFCDSTLMQGSCHEEDFRAAQERVRQLEHEHSLQLAELNTTLQTLIERAHEQGEAITREREEHARAASASREEISLQVRQGTVARAGPGSHPVCALQHPEDTVEPVLGN